MTYEEMRSIINEVRYTEAERKQMAVEETMFKEWVESPVRQEQKNYIDKANANIQQKIDEIDGDIPKAAYEDIILDEYEKLFGSRKLAAAIVNTMSRIVEDADTEEFYNNTLKQLVDDGIFHPSMLEKSQ